MTNQESKEHELIKYERGLSFFGPNIGNLFARLARVMEAAGHVQKNGENKHFNYRYVMEADLTDAIRPLLAAEGVSIVFGAQSVEHREAKSGLLTTVTCQVAIGDSDGNVIVTTMLGTGQDAGDKGLYKALTGAMKYWLYKTFLISTNDDPEQDSQQKRDDYPSWRGEQQAGNGKATGPTPPCPNCQGPMKLIPAGVSKTTGKPYNAFWSCEDKECKFGNGKHSTRKDSDWQEELRQAQDAPPVVTSDEIPF